MKKFFAILLAGVLTVGLAACGGSDDAATNDDSNKEEITLKIGASPTPHAEILNAAKDELAEKGIKLDIVEFTDYVQPNLATESGDLDANYFQHTPYLEQFNKEQGTHLETMIKTMAACRWTVPAICWGNAGQALIAAISALRCCPLIPCWKGR